MKLSTEYEHECDSVVSVLPIADSAHGGARRGDDLNRPITSIHPSFITLFVCRMFADGSEPWIHSSAFPHD